MRHRVTNKHRQVIVTTCDRATEKWHTLLLLLKSHVKDTLQGRWGDAAKPQLFADAVLLEQWAHRLKSQNPGVSACLSEGTGGSLATPPKLQARGSCRNLTQTPALHSPTGKNTQPGLLSHQEKHHSWNQGILDTFWSSWHCSRHHTDQQTQLSNNSVLKL